jgi:hypothetical protein
MDSSFEMIARLDLPRILEVQAIEPATTLVIHRRKCKIARLFHCTCRPTFVQPPARV